MRTRLLLCISQERATVALWRMRRLQRIRVFANTADGLAEFAEYVRPFKGVPARMLVDTLSEDYRFETLPHASGSDRTQLIARKIRQLYRGTAFAACELQEKLSGARREDRYLFAALTDPELVLPWLRIIEQHRLPVAGIHPLPIVALSLMELFKLKQSNLLLVSRNSAGLRQTFCKHQKFRISRLTAPREGSGPADGYYAEEVGNTRMYLDALTITHVDDTITVAIFDHDNSLASIPQVLSQDRRNMQCVHIGRDQIAGRLSIPEADLALSPDVLHLHLLAVGRFPMDLAPAHVEAGFQIYRLRQYGYLASAGIVAAALVWAGAAEFRALQLEDEMLLLIRQTNSYQRQYAEVTAQFPQAPASAEELRDTVEAARRLRQELRTPKGMMIVISRALDTSPNIALRQIDWRYGEGKTMEGLAEGLAGDPSAARRQVAIVSAEVVKAGSDHRAMLESIRGFAMALGSNAQVAEVRVLKLPMDTTSASALAGSTAETARPLEAQFQLAILLRTDV